MTNFMCYSEGQERMEGRYRVAPNKDKIELDYAS